MKTKKNYLLSVPGVKDHLSGVATGQVSLHVRRVRRRDKVFAELAPGKLVAV